MDAKENAKPEDIAAAVALAIDAGEGLDDSGVPDFDAIADQVEGVTAAEIAAAAEAYYNAKEDAAAGADAAKPGEDGGDADDGDKVDPAAVAQAQAEAKATGKRTAEGKAQADPLVIAATEKIIKAGGPFERGAPALWALRNEVGGPVSKAKAAAAYEAVTGKAWPWPPTQQEMAAAGKRRYPAGMYHKTKPSQTVADEAAESVARKDGFKRHREFTPKDWVAIWARETGATEAEQEAALEVAKRDPKRKR